MLKQLGGGKIRKIFKNTRGESLIEIVASLFVIAIGSAAATGLIVSAIQNTTLSQDNLVALNLAREGVESVRNIRDTNWLRYSYNRKDCWDLIRDDPDCVAPENKITSGNYIMNRSLESDSYLKWKLVRSLRTPPLDLKEMGEEKMEFYRLYIDTPTGLYIHNPLGKPLESKFFRMVQIERLPEGLGTGDPIRATSIVQWLDRGRLNEVRLATDFKNFLTESPY